MAWADDIHIANSLIQKTIGFMKAEQETHTLIKIIKIMMMKALLKHY